MTNRISLFLSTFLLVILAQLSCSNTNLVDTETDPLNQDNPITCTDSGCLGTYYGPEFKNGSDVAHQFSNKMSSVVGNKLKELYSKKKYSKVNLSKIEMSTIDMNHRENVNYKLHIPFISVQDSCQAYTFFDHRGGWGHTPKQEKVLAELKNVRDLEYVFTSTPEGLTEYWLQWKSKTQHNCQPDF